MTIVEMYQCIEKMRECYKFDNYKTEIRLGSVCDRGNGRTVEVSTEDDNGTHIMMMRYSDESAKINL